MDLRRGGDTRPVQVAGRDAYGAGWSLSRLRVRPLTFRAALLTGRTGLGDAVDRVVPGQAEFGGPAFDMRPEPVPLVQVMYAGLVGENYGGDGTVAIQDPAGQPGHLPEMLTPGRLPGGVSGLVAGHRRVVDRQDHGSA